MEINEIYVSLREGLKELKNVDVRIKYLKKLREAIISNIDNLNLALRNDFNKPEFETISTEVFGVIEEIDNFIKHLKRWTRPKKVHTSFLNFPSSGYIYKDPIGVVYIASPWNYPFNLTFTPLVGAIGSGDTVILRPSSSTSETSIVIDKICKEAFPRNIVYVALGGHDIADQILELDLDMVFFTGSVKVGREIYQKAASHLSRVVLELGGKTPLIVLSDADIDKAAKRTVWGKFINGGQTCIAPDYVIIDKSVKELFINSLKKYIKEFYFEDGKLTNNFPHIINDKNYLRLKSYLNNEVVFGGEFDDKKRLIYPTILDNVKFDDAFMQEEIFGPLLPIISIDKEEEIYPIIEHHSNPLATYVFSKNKKHAKQVITKINFGGGCINDTVMHLTNENLPFGGIKTSGLLAYHGYESFKVFTHFKSVLVKSPNREINFKYPPYKEKKIKFLRKIGKF